MAKRKPTQTIPPFPAEIDRTYFAVWLSGLTDGEGCFHLRQERREDIGCVSSAAVFEITLRLDELPIIQVVQAFLGCGTVTARHRVHPKMPNANPVASFRVQTIKELYEHIVPHYDAYPLLAKKKRDYAIWREGVLFLYSVKSRKRRVKENGRGTLPKWTKEEIAHFAALVSALKAQREYQAPTLILPQRQNRPTDPGLFDELTR